MQNVIQIGIDYGEFMVSEETPIFDFIYLGFAITYVPATIGMLAKAPLFSVYRFYINLMKTEGYLMLTLPVKISQHIWSKLHVMAFWMLASSAVTLLSILILSGGNVSVFVEILNTFDLLPLYLIIASIYTYVMLGYASLAIGHKLFRKYPVLGAILVFLIIFSVMQIVSLIIFPSIGITLTSSRISFLVSTAMLSLIFMFFYVITTRIMTHSLNLE